MTAARRKGALPAPPFRVPDTIDWVSWQFKQSARALVVLAVLQDEGFEGMELRSLAACCMGESGGKRLARRINTNSKGVKTNDLGPMQHNRPGHVIEPDDPRTGWAFSAAEARVKFDQRGFRPWLVDGTENWLAQFPAVDLACTWLDKADRQRHGYF